MTTPSDTIRPDGLFVPHPNRLAPDHPHYDEILRRHSEAVDDGEMGYTDPVSGLFAMAATHLASRPCCTRGCRHCPYIQ